MQRRSESLSEEQYGPFFETQTSSRCTAGTKRLRVRVRRNTAMRRGQGQRAHRAVALRRAAVAGVKRPTEGANKGKTPALSDAQTRELLKAPEGDSLKAVRDRAIREYLNAAGHGEDRSGALFRPVRTNRTGSLKQAITGDGVYKLLKRYGARPTSPWTGCACTRCGRRHNALEHQADIALMRRYRFATGDGEPAWEAVRQAAHTPMNAGLARSRVGTPATVPAPGVRHRAIRSGCVRGLTPAPSRWTGPPRGCCLPCFRDSNTG